MDKLPQRLKTSDLYRGPLKRIENLIPDPGIDANVLSVIPVLLSLVFLYFPSSFPVNVILLGLMLLLDGLDGIIARKQGKDPRHGYLVDQTFDRFSEVLLSISILQTIPGKIFLGLSIINIFLLYYSVRTGRHFLMAIRFLFFLFILVDSVFSLGII